VFFPERITGIQPSDKVLEIGPGSDPHPRSDILLEKVFADQQEKKEQRGNTPEVVLKKPIVYYEGDKFPFQDKEFDYVICSHVLEHVDNLETFLSELFRIAKRGYIEYPTIFYEYLYNFNVHKNILKFNGDTLFFQKKVDTPLNYFAPVQTFFLETLNKGYSSLVDELKEVMFEGFEWKFQFLLKQAESPDLFCQRSHTLLFRNAQNLSLVSRIRRLIKK